MFACIYIPDFPVAAIIRVEPLLRDRAVAVLDGKPPQVRVAALNDKARLLGMNIGMTKIQAAIFAIPQHEGDTSATAKSDRKKKSPPIELDSQRIKAQSKPVAAILRQRSTAQEESSHAALLDVVHAFTPRVEDTHPDRLLLDLDGLERLYGPPSAIARELASRVSTLGLDANIGVAANSDAAMHAACGFGGVTVIPAGEEARRLGVLPINVLLDSFEITCSNSSENSTAAREREKLSEQMLDTLERWGVRDFRTLALLPEHALAARLGEAGAHLQRLARGATMRTLALCEPSVRFEEAMDLESPVETLEPLSFLLNRTLDQLCTRLEARALAAQELTLRLQLEPRVGDEQAITLEELAGASHTALLPSSGPSGTITTEAQRSQRNFLKDTPCSKPARSELEGCHHGKSFSFEYSNGNLYARTLRLPVAMRDSKVFLKLLQLDLSAHPPGAPVCKLWITAEPAIPRSAQRGLFLPVTPEAEKLEITLARITGVVGERRAGIAKPLDTHRPAAFRMERFVSQTESQTTEASPTLSGWATEAPIALRIFRPARQVRVQVSEGRPCNLVPPARNEEKDVLQGKILWSAGPWRSSGDWWAQQSSAQHSTEDAQVWDREEWDIALASGKNDDVVLYRIYRDIATGDWFADASYD